eukprot:GHVU01101452.1.p1 GENE.GHVU01101452.1~~GHVU01101452.1.p1  ORF type:complete len:407 (+),score=23.04 GHVU01101452.1:907-2127(+)
MKQTLIQKLGLATSLMLVAGAALADQQHCAQLESHYKQCDIQLGWYVGGVIGQAETDISQGDIDRFFAESGINATSIAIDKKDSAAALNLGYQFHSYFAIEAGYLDLGERSVSLIGQSTDPDAFYDNAEHVYPQSGDGLSLAVVASLPLSADFKLSGKIGLFDWEGDYTLQDDSRNLGQDQISGKDIWYGAELNYRLTEQTQMYLSYQQVELDRDLNQFWGLGLRYYFNEKPEYKASPAPVIKDLPAPAPIDSDNDGIYDNADKCANTPIAYQVDNRGCTLMKEQWVDFALTIHYAHNSSQIDAQYDSEIKALAAFIKKHDVKKLTVYGHTSAVGSANYNMKLSQQRAGSVANILIENYSIDAEIIEPVGKGETQLKVPHNTDDAHSKNRRIELAIQERLTVPVKR